MGFSNIRAASDGRPFFNVETCFRFKGQRHSGVTSVPGDFFELGPRGRAAVLDEELATWAEEQGFVLSECRWELVTEVPESIAEQEGPGWGEEWPGHGKYGWKGI